MDWHETQIKQILQHADKHRRSERNFGKEQTCKICYPVDENGITEQFQEFWKWYSGIVDTQEFSGKTITIFGELITRNLDNIVEGRENVRVNSLIWSIKYRRKPDFTIKEIRARIVTMIMISEKFTRDMDEAVDSYKTKSNRNNSPEEKSLKSENMGSDIYEKDSSEKDELKKTEMSEGEDMTEL